MKVKLESTLGTQKPSNLDSLLLFLLSPSGHYKKDSLKRIIRHSALCVVQQLLTVRDEREGKLYYTSSSVLKGKR